ncbi:DUF4388 domain-containing protein [Geobacter pickeringii]|uniref:Diguanylate cyclase n=1 Tax=Geobacter pickeringii TaxID=345632 RepID=A0A0B5BGP1_9BACT|nr:DUF4388 domain-containing protein [Geobacter pickeringii]AJE03685.1 diguanylate cyclase [Geobacter pickeringii]
MSLIGNLEDLGLGEILQIVSLSRKSGILRLRSRGREGILFFRLGQVIQATSSSQSESIGEALVRRGAIEPAKLRSALDLQAREGHRERLGAILVRYFDVPPAVIEETVREQIEDVVYALFGWIEGTFDFELKEMGEAIDAALMDPMQFMLEQGLSPQYLLTERARPADEKRAVPGEKADAADRHGRKTERPFDFADGLINLGDLLRRELGDVPASAAGRPEPTSGMTLLHGMLRELNDPSLGGGITLLVLRYAAEFVNRAVIFMVIGDELVGLGQFGISDRHGSADARIRNLRIPRTEASLFSGVMEAKHPAVLKPDPLEWNSFLFGQLDDGIPEEVFVGPIVSEGKVVALLYGDNLPGKKSIGGTESLEIFLSQAGVAMEKALLERKLMENSRGRP